VTDPSSSTNAHADVEKDPVDHPASDGRYGYGFGLHQRAAELLSVEEINMPGPEFLESVDWTNEDQILQELRRAYAGGWSTGEHIASEMILYWLHARNSPSVRKMLEDMANRIEPTNEFDKFKTNWCRFNCAADLARVILDLPNSG
jgi:hypothetical protein